MTIAEAREGCKAALAKIPRDVLVISLLVATASTSFLMGYLAGSDVTRKLVEEKGREPALVAPGTREQVVASKNGTKYYPPSCADAARISEANKVWFATPEAAEEAGYTRSSRCE